MIMNFAALFIFAENTAPNIVSSPSDALEVQDPSALTKVASFGLPLTDFYWTEKDGKITRLSDLKKILGNVERILFNFRLRLNL